MILLDTTILVYAVGADHPLREPCADLVARLGSGELTATTTIEAIQEFVHVRARRRTRTDAAGLARSYADLLAPLVTVGPDDLERGLDLYEQNQAIGAFDSVLAAAALNRPEIDRLASADGGFEHLGGIHVINPMTPKWLD